MTLIVSLRIPDGVVIAGDSLSTLMGQGQFEATVGVTCPSCQHQHEIESKSPIFPVPGTTFSYAQKVLPFCSKFGIGTFGTGLIANQSVYFIIRLLEQKLEESNTCLTSATETAQIIGGKIHALLKQANMITENTPENQFLLGFQVVGYDNNQPKTIEVLIGKEVNYRPVEGLGCTVSGSQEIVQAIWGLYQTDPQSQPPYEVFSLQDAIDYAEFLISSTIAHQRFSQTIPNVGGNIDILLVTPFDEYEWIHQKRLRKTKEDN